MSKHIFDLVHMDVWGSYKAATMGGHHYFLTIVDDHYRSVWTFLLPDNTQVPLTIQKFILTVKNQYHLTIKCIRSDNGSEFMNAQCRTPFDSHGITHQHSCSYTPQQNGSVEIKHRHLLQIASALMFQSCLPSKFWGYSILQATYIMNRLPSAVLNWKSPFECLFNAKPNLQLLRTFGCLCYVSNLQQNKTKFSTRSFKCALLGMAPNQKGYVLYNIDLNTTLVSKDVIFYEDHFPFYSNPTSLPSPETSDPSPDPLPSVPSYPSIPSSPDPSESHKPARLRAKPAWLSDYICSYPSGNSLENMTLSVIEQEPQSFAQASKTHEWRVAMQ